MRLRNIKGSRETIAASKYIIEDDSRKDLSFEERGSWSVKGRWREVFGNDRPLRIEIGMGKGAFLMELARLNPEINFVGIEKYSSVLLRAVQKQNGMELPNVRLIRMEAENICDVFAPQEADRIYLNFSDPWPKAAHESRRLTSRRFFERYDSILKDMGVIEFKTDNQELFDFSVEEIELMRRSSPDEKISWEIIAITRDLHNDPELMKDNVMTEYEQRWSSQGKPICAMHILHHVFKVIDTKR